MPLILDNSCTMAWLLRESTMADHDAFGQRLTDEGAIVPVLWSLEVANALIQGARRNRIDRSDVRKFLVALEQLPIVIDRQTADRAWGATLGLTETHALTIYDAAYLELAVRLNLQLATLDRRLAAAARSEGIEVIGV